MNYLFLLPAAIEEVSKMFDLPAIGREQDWELEFANPKMVGVLVEYLRSRAHTANQDAVNAIAALLIASVDEALSDGLLSDEDAYAVQELFKNRADIRHRMHKLWFEQRTRPVNEAEISELIGKKIAD